MLYVHVLLIVARSACHMAEFDIDQHQSRAPIWECLYHAGSGVRLTRKREVSQRVRSDGSNNERRAEGSAASSLYAFHSP